MDINANGFALTSAIINAALSDLDLFPANAVTREEIMRSWMRKPVTIEIADAKPVLGDFGRGSAVKFSIANIPLQLDETLPVGVLEFRAADGRLLAKIENIAF